MAHLAAGNALFGDLKSSQPFFLMAGPNVIQSEEHIFAMCRELKRVTDELDVPFIFKSSFDKANRTSITSFRGPGIDDGLRILQAVKTTFDVPIVTDIHTEEQAEPVSAVASGGSRELIPTIARSCVAAGVDGLFMEVHNDPNSSPVDGPTQWPLRHFPELLAELKAIALATKARTGHNAQLDLTPMNIM